MIDKNVFARMRREIEFFDASREEIIKKSRDILKFSKGAIYSVHRNELKRAATALANAKKVISAINKLLKKDIHLAAIPAYSESLEEYVEASCYYSFVKSRRIPTPKNLGVDADVYLSGLCDLVGELVRKAVNSAIKNDFKTVLEIRDFVADVYAELMLFDFRNVPLRRKFDSIKYGLEKLEDLVLQLRLRKKI